MKQALLSVRDVSVDLNRRAVLRNIGFDVEDGEFFSLLGPSGCGKTTLLRLIAGFLNPTSGRVFWNGADITQQPAQKRDLNLVFQNYALFPHMNVFDNVAFGLRMKKIPAADVRDRTREALTLVRMEAFAERRIHELSGGQQQRVALARAVAPQPKMVLLDEPLGALDLQLRKQMQVELKTLQQRLGMTFIYVTHDQEEAFAMSDRIAILNQGDLEQVALPEGLYRAPASKFVAQFIGSANFLPAHMEAPPRARCASLKRDFEVFVAHPNSTASNTSHALQGEILIRPEQFALSPGNNTDTQLPKGKILLKQYLGSQMRYHIQMNSPESTTIRADLPALGHPAFDTGTEVHVAVTADHLPFFPGTACK